MKKLLLYLIFVTSSLLFSLVSCEKGTPDSGISNNDPCTWNNTGKLIIVNKHASWSVDIDLQRFQTTAVTKFTLVAGASKTFTLSAGDYDINYYYNQSNYGAVSAQVRKCDTSTFNLTN